MAITGSYYSDPTYLSHSAASELLSTSSTSSTTNDSISLSSPSLSFLNSLIDELLHLTIHNSLQSSPSSTISSSGSKGEGENVLTNYELKLGFLKFLGTSNSLAKTSILEAEIAIRSLLKLTNNSSKSNLHQDPCLVHPSPTVNVNTANLNATSAIQNLEKADDLFRSFRTYIQSSLSSFSILSQPTSGPSGPSLTRHLTLLSPPPELTNPKMKEVKFLNSLYLERCLSTVLDYLLRCLGRFLEAENEDGEGRGRGLISASGGGGGRERGKVVGLEELELAFEEDQVIWSWLSRMRVRSLFTTQSSHSAQRRNVIPNGMVQGYSNHRANSGSIDSMSSMTALIYSNGNITHGGDTNETMRRESEDGFENLIRNAQTRKFSLTPNRLAQISNSNSTSRSPLAQISTSSSLPNFPSPSPPPLPLMSSIPPSHSLSSFPTPPISNSKNRKLQPRTPRAIQIDEEEEEDLGDQDEVLFNGVGAGGKHKQLRAKESLLDMLSSEPPWKVETPPSLPNTGFNNGSSSGNGSIASRMMKSRSNSISIPNLINSSPTTPFVSTVNTKSRETSPTRLRKLSLKRKGSITTPPPSSNTTSLITPPQTQQQQIQSQDTTYLSSPSTTTYGGSTSTAMKLSNSNSSSIGSERSGVSYDSNLSDSSLPSPSSSRGKANGKGGDSENVENYIVPLVVAVGTMGRSKTKAMLDQDGTLDMGYISSGGTRRLKAKDERATLGSTKRANDDLVAFLNSSPPSSNLDSNTTAMISKTRNIGSTNSDPFRSDEEVLNGSGFNSLKKKGLRGFMSKLATSSKKSEEELGGNGGEYGMIIGSRASTSTIIRSLGRKTSRFGLNFDGGDDSSNSSSTIPALPLPNRYSNRSILTSNTFVSIPSQVITIETTPPSPTTSTHFPNSISTSTSSTSSNSIPNSKPPAYSVPSYSRPSPLSSLPNGINNKYRDNTSSRTTTNLSTLGGGPISNSMQSTKSLQELSSTTTFPSSPSRAIDPYNLVPAASSNGRSLAEDGLSTVSKRAGPVRSLSVGSLDTGLANSDFIRSSSNKATTPSTVVTLTSSIKEIKTPSATAVILPQAIVVAISTPTRSSSSLSINRRDSIPSTTTVGSSTTEERERERGGSAFDSQTNFKPVPLHILTSNIFSPPPSSIPPNTASITALTSNSMSMLTSATNIITRRDIAISPSNNSTPPPSASSLPLTSTISAGTAAIGIVSTASVVRLARSSSSRVRVPKVDSGTAGGGGGGGGRGGNRDGTPSPTTGTLPYLISTPEEGRSKPSLENEKEEEKVKEEGVENMEETKSEEEKFLTSATTTTTTSLLPIQEIVSSTIVPLVDPSLESNKFSLDNRISSPVEDLQSTLIELKKKMENASSTIECLALLDQLMKTSVPSLNLEKVVQVNRAILPIGIPVLLVEEVDLEKFEMFLVEFLLGGGDFTVVREKEGNMSTFEEGKREKVELQEKEVVTAEEKEEEEEEEQEEEEVELKMPGGM